MQYIYHPGGGGASDNITEHKRMESGERIEERGIGRRGRTGGRARAARYMRRWSMVLAAEAQLMLGPEYFGEGAITGLML